MRGPLKRSRFDCVLGWQSSTRGPCRTRQSQEVIMKISHSLIAAAVGGILIGATGCGGGDTPPAAAPANASPAATDTAAPAAAGSAAPAAAPAKNSCKGQNACKGQGNCKTDKHACKGQNGCKAQGGCKG